MSWLTVTWGSIALLGTSAVALPSDGSSGVSPGFLSGQWSTSANCPRIADEFGKDGTYRSAHVSGRWHLDSKGALVITPMTGAPLTTSVQKLDENRVAVQGEGGLVLYRCVRNPIATKWGPYATLAEQGWWRESRGRYWRYSWVEYGERLRIETFSVEGKQDHNGVVVMSEGGLAGLGEIPTPGSKITSMTESTLRFADGSAYSVDAARKRVTHSSRLLNGETFLLQFNAVSPPAFALISAPARPPSASPNAPLSSEPPEWHELNRSGISVVFADRRSIRRAGEIAWVTYLNGYVRLKGIAAPAPEGVYYSKLQAELRCKGREFRLLGAISYDAAGKQIAQEVSTTDWLPIRVHTSIDDLLAFVCNGKTGTRAEDPFNVARSWRQALNKDTGSPADAPSKTTRPPARAQASGSFPGSMAAAYFNETMSIPKGWSLTYKGQEGPTHVFIMDRDLDAAPQTAFLQPVDQLQRLLCDQDTLRAFVDAGTVVRVDSRDKRSGRVSLAKGPTVSSCE